MKRVKSNFQMLLAQKRQRENRRLSLRQVAEEADVKEYTVYGFANNSLKEYPADAIAKLCTYLNCSVGDLLTLENVEEPMFIPGELSVLGLNDEQQVQMKRIAEEYLRPFYGDAANAVLIEPSPTHVLTGTHDLYDVLLQIPTKPTPHRLQFAVYPNNDARVVPKQENADSRIELDNNLKALETKLRTWIANMAFTYARTVGIDPVQRMELRKVESKYGMTSYQILMLTRDKRVIVDIVLPENTISMNNTNAEVRLIKVE